MRCKLSTIWVILTLTSLSANAAFEGFPLATGTNDLSRNWLTAQDAWAPVRQLYAAIQERSLAAGIDELEYVETVIADVGMVTNEIGEVTGIAATGFPDENANGFYEDLGGGFYENSASYSLVEPDVWFYSSVWVIEAGVLNPLYESDTSPSSSWRIYDTTNMVDGAETHPPETIPATVEVYNDVIDIVVTNTIGDFDMTIDGTNVHGVTYVTRTLLDSMWERIDLLSEHYYLPGNRDWDTTGWSSWDSWFGSDEAYDYKIPAFTGPLSHNTNHYLEQKAWRLKPYAVKAYPALVYEYIGMTNAYYDLQTNDWGIATNGSYYTHPILDGDMDASVLLAEAAYTQSNSWQSYNLQSVTNREGVDLAYYLTDGTSSLAELRCTSTNGAAGVSAEISGTVAVLLPTNTVTTNLFWNTVYDSTAELSSAVVTNTTYYLAYSNATETLTISNQSEYVWATITNFMISPAASTNTSVALLWDVDQWNPISYRIYGEELDRMYYALVYMRYLLAVEGRDGQLVGGELSTNAAEYTASSLTQYTEPETEPWMASITNTWTTNLPLRGMTLIAKSFDGAEYSVGEFDRGAAFDKYYYEGPATNAARKDYIGIKDDDALPPWHWPQTLEIGYYFPQNQEPPEPEGNTPSEGWPVIIGRTIDDRPPSKGTVATWLDQSMSDTYGTDPATNKTRLPYAIHNRWVTGNTPYGDGVPPYDDFLRYDDDYDLWSYAGNGGDVLYTNGVPDQTDLRNRPVTSTDALHGWAGSASLSFNYHLPSSNNFEAARAYYGEFLKPAQADVSVVGWRDWDHPYTAVMTNEFAFTGGTVGFTYSTAEQEESTFFIGEFLPVRWDIGAVRYVYANYIFEGNGLLDAPSVMDSEDMYATGGVVEFGLSSSTSILPVSPGTPRTPEWDEIDNNIKGSRSRWAGCMVSDLLFLIEWDFEYK